MKLLITVLFLTLTLAGPPAWANRGNDVVNPSKHNRLTLPGVQTNVHLGLPDEKDDYPQGRNHYKPRWTKEEGSVVPEIQKYICVGADCGCGE